MFKAAVVKMERLGLQGFRVSPKRQAPDRVYWRQVSFVGPYCFRMLIDTVDIYPIERKYIEKKNAIVSIKIYVTGCHKHK